MFSVLTASRFDDNLPTPYLVALQITIEDEEFRDRMIQVARLKNVRLGCEKKSALASAITFDELNVEIVRDDERIDRVGYLDEYLEHGYVFGFESEKEAQEFEEKARNVMTEYLQAQYDHFLVLTRPDADEVRLKTNSNFSRNWKGAFVAIAAVFVMALVMEFSDRFVESKKDYSSVSLPVTADISSKDADEQIEQTIYSTNELVNAGSLTYLIQNAEIIPPAEDETSESQFVIIKVKITNNDVNPRSVSTSLFTLMDSQGRKFASDSFVWDDEALSFETINPGLSITGKVYFETPKGLTGLVLEADSGVLLAGGERVIIDLGI